jgi:uncharacterized protein involved in response to NO
LLAGLDVVLFIIAVMGGRVIPMFTNNGIPGTQASRHPLIEKLALGSVLLLLAADVLAAPAALIAGIALVAALAHAPGSISGNRGEPMRTPLVWVLHAAYAWIVVYLVLRASGGARPGRRAARAARTDHRRHRRHDARHDDAHRARPYRPSRSSPTATRSPLTCWFCAPR